jgi:hypothetical protein
MFASVLAPILPFGKADHPAEELTDALVGVEGGTSIAEEPLAPAPQLELKPRLQFAFVDLKLPSIAASCLWQFPCSVSRTGEAELQQVDRAFEL